MKIKAIKHKDGQLEEFTEETLPFEAWKDTDGTIHKTEKEFIASQKYINRMEAAHSFILVDDDTADNKWQSVGTIIRHIDDIYKEAQILDSARIIPYITTPK